MRTPPEQPLLPRARRQMLLAVLICAAVAASAAVLSSPSKMSIDTPARSDQTAAARETPAAPPAPPAIRPPDHVLVQMFRGRTTPSGREISITTIFREKTFSVLGDADINGGSEEELESQVRGIFSLKELTSLGSSIVSLSGGSAVLDDNGHQVEIHVEGQAVGAQAARLVVSQMQDGREVVASSVIARTGKTVVLAGPAASDVDGGREIDFVCLTPFR